MSLLIEADNRLSSDAFLSKFPVDPELSSTAKTMLTPMAQLTGGTAPMPTATATEAPLIAEEMRSCGNCPDFHDKHPSFNSVPCTGGLGAPSLIHPTIGRTTSSYQESYDYRMPTYPKRPEGKKFLDPPAYVPKPSERPVAFELRDTRVIAHRGTLVFSGGAW